MLSLTFIARRRAPRAASRRAGFTMLEILLVLALLGLLAATLVGGATHLLREQPVTLNDIFWRSVQEARKAALKSEKEVRLTYDSEKKEFRVIDAMAVPVVAADGFTKEEIPAIKTLQIPPERAADLTIEFLGVSKNGPAVIIGGLIVETQKVAFATFYPDGTCQPFRIQFMRNGGVHILEVDPWTCAPILKPVDPNAPPF